MYDERDCWDLGGQFSKKFGALPCTFDHFLPKLSLPLGQKEATDHARLYFNWAVKLYKAAKCDPDGRGPAFFLSAARALGHAIHLVEDMGSPQHTLPENHAPYPAGHGDSFHEYWSLV
jgi:hypothetical protein